MYCAIRLLGIVSRSPKTLAGLRDGLPTMVSTPEVRFQVDEVRKFKIVEEVRDRLKADAANDVNDLDGVRVKTADGWWLLRASNTQDVLVARAEAHDQAGLDRLKLALQAQLVQSGVKADIDV